MKKLSLDLFFQIGLLGSFAFLLWESRSYPPESGFYPRIVGGIAVILLLVSIVRHFLKKAEEKKVHKDLALRRRRFFQISLIVILAMAVGYLGGFLLSVLFYYVAYALFQEDRTKLIRNLSIGVVLTVLFYISFGWFLNVPLFRGWLLNL